MLRDRGKAPTARNIANYQPIVITLNQRDDRVEASGEWRCAGPERPAIVWFLTDKLKRTTDYRGHLGVKRCLCLRAIVRQLRSGWANCDEIELRRIRQKKGRIAAAL